MVFPKREVLGWSFRRQRKERLPREHAAARNMRSGDPVQAENHRRDERVPSLRRSAARGAQPLQGLRSPLRLTRPLEDAEPDL